MKTNTTGFEIAVIGMACRFPGAKNIREFWENLKNGVESVSFLSEEELRNAGVDEELIDNPDYVTAGGGIIENKEYFDAAFFGYTPAEAEIMDPQMRIFHECVWEAIEDAAYDPFSYSGSIGLYAGGTARMRWEALTVLSGKADAVGGFSAAHLTGKDFMNSRISYKLNLKGPVLSLQTACSTSLTAIHTACRALLMGECNMAVAGGVTITVGDETGYLYREGLVKSPDGHCRAFDADAAGFVGGSGAGAVLLKRLKFAAVDNDHIYAVIKGSAVNNDGARRAGYTAPSIEGQIDVISTALHVSKVEPESITYIEAHGTATPLGDPVEIEALTRALNTSGKATCGIGSVKTNFGHLDSAAGAAGFIKTVLALYHRMIPPSLHFRNPNPRFDLGGTPFYVNHQLKKWENGQYPLRAGVSSFGIGGTNAHVVLEEWPVEKVQPKEQKNETHHLIVWSARTETALEKMTVNLHDYLEHNIPKSGTGIGDIAYTLQFGRRPFKFRRKLACADSDEALRMLSSPGKLRTTASGEDEPAVIFMFPGLGAQYADMGLDLYRTETIFRQEIDRCVEILEPFSGENRTYRSDRPYFSYPSNEQVAMFIFEYALAKLLLHWGIRPYAMIGYSFGEYTAACLSGVFSLEDALRLIVARNELVRRTPEGKMVSVPLSREQLLPLLPGDLSLAIDNGLSCIVAGPAAAVEIFIEQMKALRHLCLPLQTDRAVHSELMTPIMEGFEKVLGRVTFNTPQIPYVSNVTGTWITVHDAQSPAYWIRHMRETVRFADGIRELAKIENALFVETGPSRDLNALVKRCIEGNSRQHIINLVRHPDTHIHDRRYLLNQIGEMWVHGKTIDWSGFHINEERHRISLPTYPFEGKRYFIDGDLTAFPRKEEKEKKLSRWFYLPLWKQAPLLPMENYHPAFSGESLLLFIHNDNGSPGNQLKQRLIENGSTVLTAAAGTTFEKISDTDYTIDPGCRDHYGDLVKALNAARRFPSRVFHLWGMTKGVEPIEQTLGNGFYSLLYLVRAIREEKISQDIFIDVVTSGMQEIDGNEILNPAKAAVLGPVNVIPQECSNIRCRSIDIPFDAFEPDRLLEESASLSPAAVIGFRGRFRWERIYEPVRLEEKIEANSPLKAGGVYLITGGLGKIGFTLARFLAEHYRAKLILTGRTSPGPGDGKIEQLRTAGAHFLFFAANAADPAAMKNAIQEGEEQFGPLNGVIHCAGLVGEHTVHLIDETEKSQCEEHFQAKLHGLVILEQLLRDKPLDFCWVMSSIASILGGLRFAAYSAANNFIDAFVLLLRRAGHPWTVVNWDIMSPGNTTAAFRRILALQSTAGIPRIVVSTGGNLQARIDRWLKLDFLKQDPTTGTAATGTLLPRPDLPSPFVAPRNPTEHALAEIFRKLFGVEETGAFDDFFELGGDSLKAITVIYKIHKQLETEIPLPEFFKLRTPEKLAEYITQGTKGKFISIDPAEKREYYPVSAAQNRFYILQQLETASTAYNVTEVKVVHGEPDRELLEKCFHALVRRHESLRTSFMRVHEKPVQRIHPEAPLDIRYFSSPSQPVSYLIHELIKPFDLSCAPLIRVALVKTGEEKYLLVVDIHHIVTDGFSYEQLVRDFSRLYQSRCAELPSLRLQYKDFSQWQNRLRETENSIFQKQEDFWLKTFEGEIPVLDIPYNFPRPLVKRFDGASLKFSFDPSQTAAVKELARTEGITLFILLLALFNILLYRLGGQEDIIIGTLLAGRNHADLEEVIGVFLEALALRNFPNGHKSFREFLKDTASRTLEAFENQDYPYEELVEKVVKKRSTGRSPLYDVMLIFQNYAALSPNQREVEKPGKVGDLQLSLYEREVTTATHDMSWFAVEMDGELSFHVQYSTVLFKETTVRRFTRYFANIFRNVSREHDVKLSEIDILPEEERKKILFEFNRTRKDFPRELCYHQRFEAQVKKTTDYTAAKHNDIHVTYLYLSRESNRLAWLLMQRGLIPNKVAAVYMRRSIDMLTAKIALFKAGCGYVPIEYDYPPERIKYILENSGVEIVMTGKENSAAVESLRPSLPSMKHVFTAAEEGMETTNPGIPGDPQRLAYLIYTSGTTGTPKGVMIHQQAMMNHLDAKVTDYSLAPDTTVAQTTAATFDTSVWQFLAVLLAGGSVHIIDREHFMDQFALLRLLQKARINIIETVPSLLSVFLDTAAREADSGLPHLKWISPTGERLPVDLAIRWFERYPGIRMVNAYGPAEAADDTTQFILSETPPAHWSTVPIGKPLQNIHNYVLDANLSPCPVGVKGEICVSGTAVGKGYWKEPERTKTSFIPNPFAADFDDPDHAVLYRTGDIGFYREDGNIECLGRLDFQVKIRGNRVEPAEIESCLRKHEGVREAVVIAKQKTSSEMYLCAYIVPRSTRAFEKSILISQLRDYLVPRLPAYMIPAFFVPIPHVPLSPNGKIDRNALPEPGIQADTLYTAPKNDTEKKLAASWSRILGVDRDTISRDADFFELGGNSIGMIRLAGELKRNFGAELPVLELFNMPTIMKIAAHLNRSNEEENETERSPYPYFHFNPGASGTIFAFPPIIGYGLGYKVLADRIPNYSFYAFHFIEEEDRVERYLRFITGIRETGPYVLFGYSAGGGLAFEVAKRLEAEGHEVTGIIIVDAFRGDAGYSLIADVGNPRLIAGLTRAVEFLGLPYVKNELLRKVKVYTAYYQELVNSGTAAADIHFIRCADYLDRAAEVVRAADGKEIGHLLSWEKSTRGRFFHYDGFGTHRDLFESPHLEKNAAILSNILTRLPHPPYQF